MVITMPTLPTALSDRSSVAERELVPVVYEDAVKELARRLYRPHSPASGRRVGCAVSIPDGGRGIPHR